MARDYEIPHAFNAAIKRDVTGKFTVSVRDFIHELVKVNHHFCPQQANDWIRRYQYKWRVYEEGASGLHVYVRYNPN
ncbi:DNA polymerase V [Gibbsiella quercinecans]|uniref:DNA polymerase V n=1 Tax=Gibbsiella quercinecans TaxID=929813 RepID=UPI000EF20434|nr:DNA polymerase V [Gibbsiella quercinecans]